MEKFFAERFSYLGWILGFTEGFGTFGDAAKNALEESSVSYFIQHLNLAKKECEAIGLRVCVVHIDEIISTFDSPLRPKTPSGLAPISRELNANVARELRASQFFRLSPDTQFYFDKAEAFGPEVSTAFPGANYDITEAGNCLALERGTASVFHAMRVLEHGLRSLAKRFSVPFEHKAWGEVIERTEKAIREIGQQPNKPADWKDDEQFYSEAATQFMHFKNAWRNYTAHVGFKYTPDEAEAIYRHVRDFMKHIAKRLKE